MTATSVPAQYRMANDIAAHLQHLPSDEAAEAVAAHIRRFWDPRMRAQLLEQAGQAGTDCDLLLAAAVDLLKSPAG